MPNSIRQKFLSFALFLLLSLCLGAPLVEAEEYDGHVHCQNNPELSERLRQQGPVLALGASVSSGLFADEFPEIVAKQMCLEKGKGYFDRFSFFNRFYEPTFHFMMNVFKRHRPKIVLALDHLYHRFKTKKFTEEVRLDLDHWIAHLVLDCSDEKIDCSEGGKFHFVKKENYHPIVILGDLYYDGLIDCSKPVRRIARHDRGRKKKTVQCFSENKRFNDYLKEKVKEYPNLFLVSVRDIYNALREEPNLYHYNINGLKRNFHRDELLFDGFHPWTNPGAYVLANIVIDKINSLIKEGSVGIRFPIPYVKIIRDKQ